MKRRELLAGALGATLARYVHAEKSSEGQELIGQTAPALQLRRWLHSPPIDMADLRGKVVLLRWWTQGCPFCEATAPALPKLQAEYGSRGLVVLGIYHPKPPGDWSMTILEEAAKEKEFTFPVALDGDWTALKRWWLQRDRAFTSVSFVVDRSGVIRYVHPGGEFHEGNQGGMPTHDACRRDYRAIDAEIAMLLNRT
jgi:peroxiredoxin